MGRFMTLLLEDSIQQINNLRDYYLVHDEFAEKHVKQNIKKYKYGLLLSKFFLKQMEPDSEITLSKKEEETIADMIDEFDYYEDKENGIVRFSYKKKESFSVDDKYELDPNKAKTKVFSLIQQPVILSESVLMMLLIKYEESISKIFRYLIMKHPQAFLSDKSITYSELISLNSNIEDIKERFISREIEAIMREPISDWYDSFKKRQKAKFLFEDNIFERFKEVYYRRNLVVHNQGIVNEVYLNNIRDKQLLVGDQLEVDKEYLENAFSLTILVLVDTFFGLRKIADDRDGLVSWITSYGYVCLLEKKWKQANYIYRVILQDECMQSIDKLMAQINYWITVKNLEGVSAIESEVNALDVSAMQLQFSVAKAALLNKQEEVSGLLDQCLQRNEIPAYYIKTWPLLNEYRASDEYQLFVEKHREELDIGEYETTANSDALLSTKTDQDENVKCE